MDGRIVQPILRCSSTPAPMNRARVERTKFPLRRFHTKWKSSRLSHMFWPEPAIVYDCDCGS